MHPPKTKDFDTILWKDESNAFSARALEKYGNMKNLINDPVRKKNVDFIKTIFDQINFVPTSILDVGCGTGGYLGLFHKIYPDSDLSGIDPGDASVKLGKAYFLDNDIKVNMKKGYSHKLGYGSSAFDLVTLFKVLQWIPRKYLARTISEVDRVLKTGGYVMIKEYLPFSPRYNQSKHNPEVYIFKQDYSKIFQAFPWYKKTYGCVLHSEMAEDYIEHVIVLKKLPITTAYRKGNNPNL